FHADVSWRDPDHALGPDRRSDRGRDRHPCRSPCHLQIALALQPAPDVWQPLIEYVLPRSLLDTALLLGGVAALSLAIGTGTAWAISLHEFRGRQMLLWLVPLPLAIPTYLVAYVYVDLFEPLGLVHQTLALWLPLQDAVRVLP